MAGYTITLRILLGYFFVFKYFNDFHMKEPDKLASDMLDRPENDEERDLSDPEQKLFILIADDEETVRVDAENLLTKKYDVKTYHNGTVLCLAIGVLIAQKKAIYTVLLDMNMDGLQGDQVLRTISDTIRNLVRTNLISRRFTDIPIIFMSSIIPGIWADLLASISPYFAGFIEKEDGLPPKDLQMKLEATATKWYKNRSLSSISREQAT